MADQPTTPSGSRWEPDPDREPTTEAPADAVRATGADPGLDIEPASPGVPGEPVAEDRRTTVRGRALVAGAATALVLGGGVAGFVIGHSAAGDATDGFTPAGFSGRQDGQPGEGQLPGFGHDRDRDGDDGFGPRPQGSTDGGSSTDGTSDGAGTTGNPT